VQQWPCSSHAAEIVAFVAEFDDFGQPCWLAVD
jgi:hypothetical protein